jgi:hypothetical protein
LREGAGEIVPSDVESVGAFEKDVTGRVGLSCHGEWNQDDATEEGSECGMGFHRFFVFLNVLKLMQKRQCDQPIC